MGRRYSAWDDSTPSVASTARSYDQMSAPYSPARVCY